MRPAAVPFLIQLENYIRLMRRRSRRPTFGRPAFSIALTNSSEDIRGARSLSRIAATAAIASSSLLPKRYSTKSSGCADAMRYRLRIENGKSLRLKVMMFSAFDVMAAASTCRSFGSGRVSPGMSDSKSKTSASKKRSFIMSRVFSSWPRLRSGRFLRTFEIHSSCIVFDHFGRKRSAAARLRSKSRR